MSGEERKLGAGTSMWKLSVGPWTSPTRAAELAGLLSTTHRAPARMAARASQADGTATIYVHQRAWPALTAQRATIARGARRQMTRLRREAAQSVEQILEGL